MCPPAPSAQNRTAVWLFTMNAPADGAAVDIPTTSGSEIRIPRRAAGGFFCPAGGLFSPLGRGGNVCAPQRGGFCSSWKRGERLRPTFLFLSREKKKRADLRAKCLASLGCAPKRAYGRRPGTKKKSAGSGFRDESCSFFVCALCPENGFPGAMRTGFTFCAAAADGVGELLFYVEKAAFIPKAA